ncbi:hypothetical protein WSM22_20290 [Cytophagales bacterium WSM2-2]|nr:hypothetical protein WSM22_20290 [Cytophagales bacterium WSM2-2]
MSLTSVNFTPLSIKINSVYAEVKPVITGNGKYLFFCRRNHPGNLAKEKDKQDIWVSALGIDDQWSDPRNLGENINGKNADVICSVNDDGTEIYFFNEIIDTRKPLMRSMRNGGGWAAPTPVEIENFYNQNSYIDIFVSSKNKVLILAIQQKDTRGDQDLYVSFPRGENKWSEPINMGTVVNSGQADFAPFLSADGRTLFFSSYRAGGFGGCDIYCTTRLDDTWTKWSAPVNLGSGINSNREESNFSISADNRVIYFESYDPEHEVRDIFKAELPKEFQSLSDQRLAARNNK